MNETSGQSLGPETGGSQRVFVPCLEAFKGVGVPGDKVDHLGALAGSRAPPLCRPGSPPGIVVSGHRDNTGQCHEGGSCMGGWAGGYVPKGPETAGQLGGLGRHSLLPATPRASEPCHHQHALQNVTAQGFHVTALGSDCGAGLREDLGEHYPGSGWDAQGTVCPLPSFLLSTGLSLPLSFSYF